MASETHGAEQAVEGAAHAADHSAGAAFPPFDTSTYTSQLFWLAISFVLLYVLLSRVILPRIGGILEQRKGRIASDLDEAARMKSEADEALVEMDKKLAVARAESRIAASTASKAAELDARLDEAETRIDAMKAKAMSSVSEIATSTTEVILAQFGIKASAADVSASVKQSIDEVSA